MKGLEPGALSMITQAEELENKINTSRDRARKGHAKLMQAGTLDVRSGLVYIDLMTNFEKIGDYCYNVAEMTSEHMSRRT